VRNVAALRRDPDSILHLYRRLLAARHGSTALQTGAFERLESVERAAPGVVAWRRWDDAGAAVVAVNMGEDAPVDVEGTVLVASDGVAEGSPFGGVLGADRAVLIGQR
jgi:glycosidase